MNERAVCSQGRLASCRRCCARRALLTLNPGAWLGTNICTEHSWALPVGHLGTWNSWALPGGTPGHLAQLGTAQGTSGCLVPAGHSLG